MILHKGKHFFFCLLALSCTVKKIETKSELIDYSRNVENGLVQVVAKEQYVIEMSYRPKELVWFDELHESSSKSDSLHMKIESFDYFALRISKKQEDPTNALAGDDAYKNALSYLSAEVGNDLKLIVKGDTISPIEFNYSPGYGTSDASSVLIAFDANLNIRGEDFQLLFNDSFFKTGLNLFHFQMDDIKNIPHLL